MSAAQCSKHYTPDGTGDVLDIVVHQNVRLAEIIVTDILDSDQLPIMLSILDSVGKREALDPVEKLTHWEFVKSLASELISQNIQIHSSNETDEAAYDFAASVASAYRKSTTKTAILDRKYEIPDLEKHQKSMARNHGSRKQNGNKLGHSKCQENGPGKST
jgi:hypothetical protein